ncbi:MAG: ABC transporter permease, partial [Ktedonobacterales bacterium]
LQTVLPTTIDFGTVAAGVAVGFVTALIFGLLPITQAAQVRPQAVLRESPEPIGWRGRILTGALLALLVVLFFGLSLSILRNVEVAALAVGGAGVFFLALSLLFGGITLMLSKLPIAETFRWWMIPLFGALLLVAGALIVASPAFGALCLVVIVAGLLVELAPRNWKANVKLALRNLGRQKARTVTTLLALYIGVFAIGLTLVLGQNISTAINSYLLSGHALNVEVIASSADKSAVERQIALIPHVSHESVMAFTQAAPVAINGQPIGPFVARATASGTYTASEVAGVMNGVQGYNLAHGQRMDAVDTPLASGRALNASDIGAHNALLPVAASQAPSNLRLGDTVTMVSQADHTPVTVTIVGFYSSKIPQDAPILTDI